MNMPLLPDECAGKYKEGISINKSTLDCTVGDTIHSLFANTYEHVCSVPLCSIVDLVWPTPGKRIDNEDEYRIAITADNIHTYIKKVISPGVEMSSEASAIIEYLVRNLVFMKLAFMREFLLRRYDSRSVSLDEGTSERPHDDSSDQDTMYLDFESWFSNRGNGQSK